MNTRSKQLVFLFLLLSFLVYSAVVYTSGTKEGHRETSFSPEAKRGKLVFQEYNCIACHQIYGLGGYMGPDLTNALSRRENGETIARAYLISGTDRMPNFNLSKDEVDALIAFLKYLDRAGNYPVTDFEISPVGTIETKDLR